ncbi:MAG: TolC family protein [Spirochaetaceae bacterium]|nr:TolC family protein [Spirochaetaceae bacterium]
MKHFRRAGSCLGTLPLLLLLSVPVFAQERETMRLTLDRAVELALAENLAIRTGAITLATQASQAKNLWAQVFPAISATGGAEYSSSNYPDIDLSLTYNASVTVSLKLTPALPGAMRAISLAYRSQLLTYESARNQLALQVAKSYYQLVRDARNLENLRGTLDLAQRQAERNRTLFNNGALSQINLLRSQLSAEEARLNVSRGEASYSSSRASFFVSLGLDQNLEVILEDEMHIERLDLDSERLIAAYLPRRPDLAAKRQDIECLEITGFNAALSRRLPVTVDLSAGVRGGPAAGAPWNNTVMPVTAGISVSIPLNPWIPGTQENQAIRTARDNIERAKLELEDVEHQARLRIRTLTEDLRNSWAAIEIARLRLAIAERAWELADQGFRNGTVDFLYLEDARNSMALARQDLLNSEYNYLSTTLDLLAALNASLDELRSAS